MTLLENNTTTTKKEWHDDASLDLIKSHLNLICSYLDIDPNKASFNHLYTVNNKDRNESNGYINFRLSAQQVGENFPERFGIRVLPRVFNDRLQIPAKRINSYINAEYIVFAEKTDTDHLYIAHADPITHKQEWLLKPEYRRMENHIYDNGVVTTNFVFNIKALLQNHQIIEILSSKFLAGEQQITVFLGGNPSDDSCRTRKPYYDYNIDTSNIDYVQYDPRTSRSCFYCFGTERYTEHLGTFSTIAETVSELTDLSKKAIIQRLYRAYNNTLNTGLAYKFTVPAKKAVIGNCMYDQRMVDEDGNISMFVSTDPTFDVIDNAVKNVTADMKTYQKTYQEAHKDERKTYKKVLKYSKTHSEPKASWTDEEKTLFWKIKK